MLRIYVVSGVWKEIGKSRWEFCVDRFNNASVLEIEEDLKFEELLKMINDDFEIQNREFHLSYGISLKMKSYVEDSPPVCVKNDRNLRSFINLIKGEVELSRLCVNLGEHCNLSPADNVGSNINSTINEDICEVENIERAPQLLRNLCGGSQEVGHITHGEQLMLTGNVISSSNAGERPIASTNNEDISGMVDNERAQLLPNLCGDSQSQRPKAHGKQHMRTGNVISASVENRNTSSQSKGPNAHGKRQMRTDNVISASGENSNTSPTANIGEPSVFLHTIPDFSPIHYGLSPSSTRGGFGDINVNKYFKNKDELMFNMRRWALECKFEFLTRWSSPERVVLCCVDKNCSWKMCARKLPSSDFFIIKKYVHGHSCDTTHRNANHRQATAKYLGSLICSNYGEKKEGLTPKQIVEQVRLQHGVQLSYKQAWRVKEEAQKLIRGTPEDSYFNLSKWLYKVKETNPGSLVYLRKDAEGKFKYCFVAFGPSIRGFAFMRRVIAIDGTFLKGKFKGTLLGASAQDGDYHLYPLAFGIVDSENEASWTWFLQSMTCMIPDAADLVFVSDRAPSIATALSKVYPLAHHGICRVHLLGNIKPKYGKTGLLPLVETAADAYTCFEFHEIFNEIRNKCPALAKYLEEADFKKWTRCYAPSNRYNIMTTNIAESLNSLLRMPRELPLISLLETIRMTLSTWFHERREAAAKNLSLVTPRVKNKLLVRYDDAMLLNVYQVDANEFEVIEECNKYVVHLGDRHCTCNVFDIDKIPCIHAVAAAQRTKRDSNRLVDNFHLNETWAKAYAETIHPCGDLTTCTFPDAVGDYSCPPPATKKSSGRPPTKRKRSVGEFGVPGSKSQSHKCTRCGLGGHNKTTCRTAI